jgi:hypothetical protein
MKQTKPRRKPGPHEQLHSLAPLDFNQALDILLRAKPTKKATPKKHKPKKSSPKE